MAAVTIHSDFGAQKNEVWHCFHCLPIYLPWAKTLSRRKKKKKEEIVIAQVNSVLW